MPEIKISPDKFNSYLKDTYGIKSILGYSGRSPYGVSGMNNHPTYKTIINIGTEEWVKDDPERIRMKKVKEWDELAHLSEEEALEKFLFHFDFMVKCIRSTGCQINKFIFREYPTIWTERNLIYCRVFVELKILNHILSTGKDTLKEKHKIHVQSLYDNEIISFKKNTDKTPINEAQELLKGLK